MVVGCFLVFICLFGHSFLAWLVWYVRLGWIVYMCVLGYVLLFLCVWIFRNSSCLHILLCYLGGGLDGIVCVVVERRT